MTKQMNERSDGIQSQKAEQSEKFTHNFAIKCQKDDIAQSFLQEKPGYLQNELCKKPVFLTKLTKSTKIFTPD